MSEQAAPAVSVVMAVYNGEATVAEAVNSILNQTLRDLELNVVFDKSIDRTEEILREIAARDPRLHVIPNVPYKVVGRLTAALNEGLKASRGRFIARMDADDTAMPDRLAIQMRFLEEHPNVGLCGTAMDFVSRDGKVLRKGAVPALGADRVKVVMEYGTGCYHPTWMMRREVYEKVGPYRYLFGEDYDYLLRVLENGYDLDNCPEVGVIYRTAPLNRVKLFTHKGTVYAKQAFRLRQRGLSDAVPYHKGANVAMPKDYTRTERIGIAICTYGFKVSESHKYIGYTIVMFGLPFLPAMALLTFRRIVMKVRLALGLSAPSFRR